MSKITIVSSDQIEAKRIQNALESLNTDDSQEIEFSLIRPPKLAEQLNNDIDLLVYNHHLFLDLNVKQLVMDWRKKGFLGSTILISKLRDRSLFEQLNKLHNFVVIEKPYEDKDLVGIAFKYLRTVQVDQRRFRRFDTDQLVSLESYKSEFKADSVVINMSMGGILVKGLWAGLKVGDLLKIQFPLDKVRREHTMHARVIWVNSGEICTAGLQFLPSEVLYQELMESMGEGNQNGTDG